MAIKLRSVIFTVVFTLHIGYSSCHLRKLSSAINPGCTKDCDFNKNVLIHITADGSGDTLHHIWDFTHKPSFILAATPLNTSLSINWTAFESGNADALWFSSEPMYSFSFVLDQIIEFNDVNNTAIYVPEIYNASNYKLFKPYEFEWNFDWSKFENTTSNVFAAIEGVNKTHEGTITLSLSAYGTTEYSKIQPHLLHTVNSSQMDVTIEGFPTTKNFKSRFALIFAMVSSDSPQSSFTSISRRSLNDEHSPGVFKIAGVKSSNGYLQWRMVAYTSHDRLMTSSTDVTSSLQPDTKNSSFNHTAISSLFGNKLHNMLVNTVVLSFGSPGDAFYSTTRYLSWTFLGAIGEPIDDGFSLLVLLIVCIGIGLPAILIIFGSAYIVVKRISRKSQDIVFSDS